MCFDTNTFEKVQILFSRDDLRNRNKDTFLKSVIFTISKKIACLKLKKKEYSDVFRMGDPNQIQF